MATKRLSTTKCNKEFEPTDTKDARPSVLPEFPRDPILEIADQKEFEDASIREHVSRGMPTTW
ncbi:hypothetical protein ACFOGJ_18115 [Marinibaculum pumilum]|uniref:Uncharacterized protein n=1 Tax=Marinibaculum pumilum TaxID=1766165 RepID=A0ABV7L3G3_9PROT